MIHEPPYAYRGQSLADHIVGCMMLIERFLKVNQNYLHVTCSRLIKAGVKVPSLSLVENMLKVGVIVHDVGKAYNHYQEKLEKYGSGFEYHEVLSATACYKILYRNPLSEDQKLEVLLLLSILNHHQAFRESLPEILFDVNSSINKVIKIAKKGLCKSISNLEPVLNLFRLRLEEIFPEDFEEFTSILHTLRQILTFFLKIKFEENRRWIKLYNLVMFPIVLADNLDASERREGSQSRLVISELRRMMKDE